MTSYLDPYRPLIIQHLRMGEKPKAIARELHSAGIRSPWARWSDSEESEISSMSQLIRIIQKELFPKPLKEWVVSTPESVEYEIMGERGEVR